MTEPTTHLIDLSEMANRFEHNLFHLRDGQLYMSMFDFKKKNSVEQYLRVVGL